MPQHGAASQTQQQVFGAPVDRLDALTGERPWQPRIHRPPQAVVVDRQPQNGLAQEVRFQTAAGSFNFGKFGHERYLGAAARSRRASSHCHDSSGGTPHSTSRIRLTAETASASSVLIPTAWPNTTSAASCTPRPAGTMKARCRSVWLSPSSMMHEAALTGWSNRRSAHQISNDAETSARNSSVPAAIRDGNRA